MDPNHVDDSNHTALSLSLITAVEPAVVKRLLEAGADVNVADNAGNTPLIWATWSGQEPNIIKMLVEAGAEINYVDGDAYSPLMWALAGRAEPETISILLEGGADLELVDYITPLSLALNNECSAEIIIALIEAGADVNKENEDGSHPFLSAILYDYGFNVFTAFVEAGADLFAGEYGGNAALMYAAINLSADGAKMVEYLLARGLSVDARDFSGSTPLLWAAGANTNADVFHLLIKAGADGTLRSGEGKNAFDYAANNESLINTEEYWLLNEARF